MFSEIITSIRAEIICELKKRCKTGDNYVFRKFNDEGDDDIYVDLSVGCPSEMGYYPDVFNVWGGKDGNVYVTVQDECGDESDYGVQDGFLDVSDLAAILDAIIDGKPVIQE